MQNKNEDYYFGTSEGERSKKRKSVLDKLTRFFERFFGISRELL